MWTVDTAGSVLRGARNNSADRLTRPLVREGDRLVESDWATAMGRVVARSRELLDGAGGWGRFGFYTSGQLFLEDHYTLGVIGKAGHQHAAGQLRWLRTRMNRPRRRHWWSPNDRATLTRPRAG